MLVDEAIARTVHGLGVTHVFGLMGRGNIHVLRHLKHTFGITCVGSRHEAAAVAMADAYARRTGRLGVATVSLGPAVTNCVTPITEAASAGTPLLLLAGERPTGRADGRGVATADLFSAVNVPVVEISTSRTASGEVWEAARQAVHESRPVVLSMPVDLLRHRVLGPIERLAPLPPPSPVLPDEDAVAQAARIVAAGRRIVVLAGRGALASGTAEHLAELAELSCAVLATTLPAAGLFTGHRRALGTIGVLAAPAAEALLAEADTLLAFGSSLDRFATRAGHLFPNLREIVHCTLDDRPAAAPVTLRITADAAATARALAARSAGHRSTEEGYDTEEITRAAGAAPAPPLPSATANGADGAGPVGTAHGTDESGLVDPRALLARLDTLLPQRRTLVPEPGHACGHALQMLRIGQPRGMVALIDTESIGMGLAAAVGAATARPDEVTVAALGDGGALMALGELETMIRHRLPILVVVLNDSAYGAEVRELEISGQPVEDALFPPTDFAAVARSLGAVGVTVRGLDDLAPVRPWLADRTGPLLLDCKIDHRVPAEWFTAAIGAPDGFLRRPRPGYRAAAAGPGPAAPSGDDE